MSSSDQHKTAGFTNSQKDKLRRESVSAENTRNKPHHRSASRHFDLALKWHHKAAAYHEDGNHDKANEASTIAMGHASFARRYQTEDIECHAVVS